MKITVQKKEGFLIASWSHFSCLDQAIEMAKQQTGRVCVLQGEKVVWENEEAITWRYPKTLTCHFYSNDLNFKTVVEVGYQNESTCLWDTFYAEHEKLKNDGFRSDIETSVKVPGDIGKHLEVGVFVFNGKVNLEDYISKTTPYQMKYVRRKNPDEAIGGGKTPGSWWQFELKKDAILSVKS